MEIQTITRIPQPKGGYKFCVTFDSGDPVTVSARELHSYPAFQRAVLEQRGEFYEHHSVWSARSAHERTKAWNRALQDGFCACTPEYGEGEEPCTVS